MAHDSITFPFVLFSLPFSMICLIYLGTLYYNSTVEIDLYTSVSRFTTIVLKIKLNNYNYNRRRHRWVAFLHNKEEQNGNNSPP